MRRRLHIGGITAQPGWEILNLAVSSSPDHIGSISDLSRFSENTFESIYASHVLEHVDYAGEVQRSLAECHRVLVPGGKIYVSVPDMDILARLFLEKDRLSHEERFFIMRMMYGGHIDEHDFHYVGFNEEFLNRFLVESGFIDVQRVDEFGIFNDTSSMRFKDIPISLNMVASKPISVEVQPDDRSEEASGFSSNSDESDLLTAEILVVITAHDGHDLSPLIRNVISTCSPAAHLSFLVLHCETVNPPLAPRLPGVPIATVAQNTCGGSVSDLWLRSCDVLPGWTHALMISSDVRMSRFWDLVLIEAVVNYPGGAIVSGMPRSFGKVDSERGDHVSATPNPRSSLDFAPDVDGYCRFEFLNNTFSFCSAECLHKIELGSPNCDSRLRTQTAYTHGFDVVGIPTLPAWLHVHPDKIVDTLQASSVESESVGKQLYPIGEERTVEEFETVYQEGSSNRSHMLSIPVPVHNSIFEWQMNLFWFFHKLTYGRNAYNKVLAAVVERNTIADAPVTRFAWNLDIPHCMVVPFFDYRADLAGDHIHLCLNTQTALAQLLDKLDDNQVVELLDCDMMHVRPAPRFEVGPDVLVVADIYEGWHLKTKSDNRSIVEKYLNGPGSFYNGGYLPIIGLVSTFRKIMDDWINVYLDILHDRELGELHRWWGGMYALQVACERNYVQMIGKDILFVPGINQLSSKHYVVHYCVDPVFKKKQFPNIDRTAIFGNSYYDRILYWWKNVWDDVKVVCGNASGQ